MCKERKQNSRGYAFEENADNLQMNRFKKVGRVTNDAEDRNKGLNVDSLDVTLKSSRFITHEETGSLKGMMSSGL